MPHADVHNTLIRTVVLQCPINSSWGSLEEGLPHSAVELAGEDRHDKHIHSSFKNVLELLV